MLRKAMIWCFTASALTWFTLVGTANGQQSPLPPCPGEYSSLTWTNCLGEMTYREGGKYIGEFKHGMRDGKGTYTWPDGQVYVGQYKNNNYDGLGTYTSPTGERYIGEYKNDRRNGRGTHTLPNGEEYVGEFKDGVSNGSGTYTWPDGQKYVGEFKDGKFNGQGNYTSPTGERYVGEYRNGVRTGRGAHRVPNGEEYIGEFVDGVASGKGTYTWPDGQKYVGEVKDGKFDGQGTYTSPLGERYIGEYKDGKRNGQGVYTLPSGEKYVGEFKDSKANGLGIQYAVDGSILRSGIWENEVFLRSALVNLPVIASAPSIGMAAPPPAQVRPDELATQRAEANAAKKNQTELEERLRQAATTPAPTSVPVPSRSINAYALVIGNTNYPGNFRLTNPVNDAKAMSEKLRSLGFNVTEVLDANRAKLVSTFSEFARAAARADLTLLFYSGHAMQLQATNYLLPTDLDQTDLSQAALQGISLTAILDQFMPGETRLVFLDACRDNPFSRTTTRGFSKGLAQVSGVAQGTLIAYATKDGQTAADGYGQRNSPWTTALLQHLDDPTDIAIVLRAVRQSVMQATRGRQEPWEYGSLTGGQLVLSRLRAIDTH